VSTFSRSDVTQLLQAWSSGDRSVQGELWPAVYAELSRLAHRYMRQERADHTLQTGALVNEAYMRLVDWENVQFHNRSHFFGMCSRMMRQILVDHARSRVQEKRGGHRRRESLDGTAVISPEKSAEVLALNEALGRLSVVYPRKAEVVEMRFFGGMSVDEVAAALNVARLTVIRDWNFARAWLLADMSGQPLHDDKVAARMLLKASRMIAARIELLIMLLCHGRRSAAADHRRLARPAAARDSDNHYFLRGLQLRITVIGELVPLATTV
jgi:RNA polymerase sigma factor (TIGR02999 family)